MKASIFGVPMAAALSAALLGCSSSQSESQSDDGDFRIAHANYHEELAVFNNLRSSLQQQVDLDGSGVTVDWYDNKGDAAQMINNVQQMIQSEPDAIILWPVSAATEGVSQLLERSGIPCVSVNIPTPACAFLNIDNAALGRETAEIVGAEAVKRGWTPENTTVLIGQVADGGDAINNCVKHFYSTLTEVTGWPKVSPDDIQPTTTRIPPNGFQFNGENALQPSYEAVSNLAASIPADNNIILYTTANDATRGALQALTQAGFTDGDKILIGGLEGDAPGLKALAENPSWVAEGDVFINYWGQYGVGLAQAVAAGVEVPEITPLPQAVYGKDELSTYHPDGTPSVDKLPPFVADNEFLGDTPFFNFLDNVAPQ